MAFASTLALAIGATLLVRALLEGLTTGAPVALTDAWLFGALKALTVDQRVLDINETAKAAQDFRSFFHGLAQFAQSVSLLQAFDLLMGGLIVVNLLRSAFGALAGGRDDSAYMTRALMQASVGRHDNALRLTGKIGDKARRADLRMMLAVARGDVEDFLRRTEDPDSDSLFAALGASPEAVRFSAIDSTVTEISTEPANVLKAIEAFWQAHRNPTFTMAHYLAMSAFRNPDASGALPAGDRPQSLAVIASYHDIGQTLAAACDESPDTLAAQMLNRLEQDYGPSQTLFLVATLLSVGFGISAPQGLAGRALAVLAAACALATAAVAERRVGPAEAAFLRLLLLSFEDRIAAASGGQVPAAVTELAQKIDTLMLDENIDFDARHRTVADQLSRVTS